MSFSKLLPENCSYQDLQQTPSYIKWLILSLHLIHLFYFFWRGGRLCSPDMDEWVREEGVRTQLSRDFKYSVGFQS